MQELQREGLNVSLRSRHERLMPWTSVYVADTLGSASFSSQFDFVKCLNLNFEYLYVLSGIK